MKAIAYQKFGNIEVLQTVEESKPSVQSKEVLVKVKAVSINPLDWKIRKGEMKLMSGSKFPKRPGVDFSGIIEAVGASVSNFKKGDEVFFYHSNEGTEIVGIAKVAKEYYQDPTTEDTNWVVVDLKQYKKLKNPVSLATVKADKRLADMALVRLGRLSVQPVTEQEWKIVMELSEA